MRVLTISTMSAAALAMRNVLMAGQAAQSAQRAVVTSTKEPEAGPEPVSRQQRRYLERQAKKGRQG